MYGSIKISKQKLMWDNDLRADCYKLLLTLLEVLIIFKLIFMQMSLMLWLMFMINLCVFIPSYTTRISPNKALDSVYDVYIASMFMWGNGGD